MSNISNHRHKWLRTTLECLAQLYDESGVSPENMEWNISEAPRKVSLALMRDAPYFTRELRRDVPGVFIGAIYAALGKAGAKSIEAKAYGSVRVHPSAGRYITAQEVMEAVSMTLGDRFTGERVWNAGNYLWLHFIRVAYAEMALEDIVKIPR